MADLLIQQRPRQPRNRHASRNVGTAAFAVGVALTSISLAPATAATRASATIGGVVRGTYVESPNRIGPFVDGKGAMYFVNETSEADPGFQMLKSTDAGASWAEVTPAKRPSARDLESVDVQQVGSKLYIAHQRSGGNVYFHIFRMSDDASPDSWQVDSQLVVSSATSGQQAAVIGVRPNGSVVLVYAGQSGSTAVMLYRVRSTGGSWSSARVLDASVGAVTGAAGITDSTGALHVFYAATARRTLYHRTISASDTLSSTTVITTRLSSDLFPIVSPVVTGSGAGETVTVGYHASTGRVETADLVGSSRRPRIEVASDQTVGRNFGTSEQPVATLSATADDVALIYADAATLDIWVDRRSAGGSWGVDREAIDRVTAHWIRSIPRAKVSGDTLNARIVWDMGSNGGVGDSRYAKISIV